MTSMNMNNDPNWLKKKVEAENGVDVSAGFHVFNAKCNACLREWVAVVPATWKDETGLECSKCGANSGSVTGLDESSERQKT